MDMPHAATEWTAAMLRDLPDDGRRYEVVDGELLVTPAPAWRHQRAVGALYLRLATWLAQHRLGEVIVAPADVELDARTLVQPDLFVVPLVDGRRPDRWEDVGTLLLAIEVLSPSSARADRHLKRRRYQRQGVPDYWIVDLDARLVERWRPADERPEILAESLEWQPAAGEPALAIDLTAFFEEVLDA
jgi:Uma2 family endonuclease